MRNNRRKEGGRGKERQGEGYMRGAGREKEGGEEEGEREKEIS